MKILVCGDVHGEFSLFNRFLNTERPNIVLQCGDFGYWPKFFNTTYLNMYGRRQLWQAEIKNKNTKIFWCDGNHEDHESLKNRKTEELWPGVYYMERGSVLVLPDGRKVLFIGGAYSIDKEYRTAGYDWFPDETITQRDIEELPDDKIDVVISHTAPIEFDVKDPRKEFRTIPDPSRDALSFVYNKYKPKRWFFGHFHFHTNGRHNDCYWTALSNIGSDQRWYTKF